jgi:hypothetical protein
VVHTIRSRFAGRLAVTLVCFGTFGSHAFAQAKKPSDASFDPIECLAAAIGTSLDSKTPTGVKAQASDCATVVDAVERDSFDAVRLKVLEELLAEKKDGTALLRDLNLKPKIIDDGQGETTLALSYKFNRDIALVMKPVRALGAVDGVPVVTGQKGTGWKISLSGTFAAKEALNSDNFLDSSFAFSMIRETGGAAGAAHLFSEEYARELDRLDMEAATLEDEGALMNHPATRELRRIQSMLGSQLYTALDLRAGLEANQSFTEKNYVYGAQLGVDYKSLSRDSMAARLNILDYPFALIRYLTNYPGVDGFAPSGVSFPTLLIGIDQVDPQGDDARAAVGAIDTYTRVRAELAFRTPLIETAQGTYKVTANARYYRELGASTAVKNQGLDVRSYLCVAIVAPSGVFISYRSGDLPFDLKSQTIYELGFHTYFK